MKSSKQKKFIIYIGNNSISTNLVCAFNTPQIYLNLHFLAMLKSLAMYLNRTLCKQAVGPLIRHCILWHLIWGCSVCLCPTKRTLCLYGLMLHICCRFKHILRYVYADDRKHIYCNFIQQRDLYKNQSVAHFYICAYLCRIVLGFVFVITPL